MTKRIFSLKNAVLGVLVITTLWIFGGSFLLNKSASKLFPQLTGGIVLVLLLTYFGWELLPEDFKNFLPEHEALTYGEDEQEGEERNEKDVLFTFASMGGLIVGIYVLGFLIAIPLYLYLNLWYFDYGTRRKKLFVVLISLLVTIVAYVILTIPIDQGLLLAISPRTPI